VGQKNSTQEEQGSRGIPWDKKESKRTFLRGKSYEVMELKSPPKNWVRATKGTREKNYPTRKAKKFAKPLPIQEEQKNRSAREKGRKPLGQKNRTFTGFLKKKGRRCAALGVGFPGRKKKIRNEPNRAENKGVLRQKKTLTGGRWHQTEGSGVENH